VPEIDGQRLLSGINGIFCTYPPLGLCASTCQPVEWRSQADLNEAEAADASREHAAALTVVSGGF